MSRFLRIYYIIVCYIERPRTWLSLRSKEVSLINCLQALLIIKKNPFWTFNAHTLVSQKGIQLSIEGVEEEKDIAQTNLPKNGTKRPVWWILSSEAKGGEWCRWTMLSPHPRYFKDLSSVGYFLSSKVRVSSVSLNHQKEEERRVKKNRK